MYSRQFKEPPSKIVENGKANFGTFLGISQKLGIKGMRAPYAGVPIPTTISKIRIKSRLNYIFSIDEYIGMVEFFDSKVFGLIEVYFWNKETGKKYVYHTVIPPRYHFIPLTSDSGICASYKKRRYIKIVWGRHHQHNALSFRVKGDSVRPNAEGFFFSPIGDKMHKDIMFVNPSPVSSRCTATWFSAMSLDGQIMLDDEKTEKSHGLGVMIMNRAYIKIHSIATKAWGLGTVKDKQIIFQVSSSNLDASDPDKYNSNILIEDGEPTALPSVVMTHPFGINKKWIIQDTESMVDLTFTPISLYSRVINIIAMRRNYSSMYGTFDGVLLNSKGEKIILKNFPGIINRDFLRSLL